MSEADDGGPETFGESDTSAGISTSKISDRFGKYAVVGPLARGGMAELLLALQEADGINGVAKIVALKRVLPSAAEQPAFVQMFLDEARLASRLDHPNIVRMYDVGSADGRYFLSMEYLPAEDFYRLMVVNEATGKPIEPSYAAALISAACEGLHFAHELTNENGAPLNLVHRDISPSNILLTYYGQVKIVDFGIAKAASNSFHTQAGIMKGKAAYFAPEQISHGPLDRRVDVYSMGIVLWELLAGRSLFQRETHAATMGAAAVGEVPDIADLRPDIDDKLRKVVLTALERNPEDRYQTAGEFHEALEGYLDQLGFRPTARELGSWLETIFGERRATLKRSLARGINLSISLDELRDLDEALARQISSQTAPPQQTTSRHPFRPKWQGILVATATVALAATTLLALRPRPQAAAPMAFEAGILNVTSTPSGALIFLDGEPTGKVTPAELSGLTPGKQVEVRAQLPAHTVAKELAVPRGTGVVETRFALHPE